MPRPRARWIAVAVAAAAFLALPAAAQATLVYVKGPLHPAVYVAKDNGSTARKVGAGRAPRISPDGESIVYLREGKNGAQEMKLAPAGGGPSKTLMSGWRESFNLAFSPDSTTIAALRGPELGKRKLVVVDLASGAQRVVAQGYFSGFSFSPDGTELAYSKAGSEKYPPRSDVYRVPAAGGKAVRLTTDRRSEDPLWGPNGQIVFVKPLDAGKRKYGPKNELFLMNPQGKAVKRLTHAKVDPLLQGLFPTAWSADGSRLLAEFEGQDTSYAVAVNPKTGGQRPVITAAERCPGGARCRTEIVTGFVGTALSADGETVLGFTGGFEPGPNHDVASVPYPGSRGKLEILAHGAFEPDWDL